MKATFDYILIKPAATLGTKSFDQEVNGIEDHGSLSRCVVERVLLPPADDLVLGTGSLLPNPSFPSDHIPLVADIRVY
jgi:hypothetical protein